MTSAKNPKTILLKGQPIGKEGRRGATSVVPGQLVQTNGQTEDGKNIIVPHATAAGFAQPMFARENEVIGKGIDDPYENQGDTVLYYYNRPGDEVYALIGNGVNVTGGTTFLESAGDGTLRAFTNGIRVAKALETKTAVGTERLKVEVL